MRVAKLESVTMHLIFTHVWDVNPTVGKCVFFLLMYPCIQIDLQVSTLLQGQTIIANLKRAYNSVLINNSL